MRSEYHIMTINPTLFCKIEVLTCRDILSVSDRISFKNPNSAGDHPSIFLPSWFAGKIYLFRQASGPNSFHLSFNPQ